MTNIKYVSFVWYYKYVNNSSKLKPQESQINFSISYRGYPCFGLAAIFAGMLYNVQIIQKSSTRNIMHVNIIVLKLPAKLHEVID